MVRRLPVGFGVVCWLVLSLVCVGMEPLADSQETAAGGGTAQRAGGRVTASVVFAGDQGFVDAVKAACQEFQSDKLQDCFAAGMKKAKATLAAVQFSKQLGEPGFVREFRAAGPVDIAYVWYPYRANEQQSILIVNGEPATVDVDNHKLIGAEILKGNARFVALARAHKEVSLWPGDRYSTELPDVEMGVNAGARVVVNYRLREQCHACAVLGDAWVVFSFDPKGKFLGAKLLAITTAREKASIARDAAKPVALAAGEEFSVGLPMSKEAGHSEWILVKALDTHKLRLIEHSHVAPPTGTGAEGNEEIWKFAALGAGAGEIEFQKAGESGAKPVRFRVLVRGATATTPAVTSKKAE
jgi:hypothetical protein